jgi:hypothetical protein
MAKAVKVAQTSLLLLLAIGVVAAAPAAAASPEWWVNSSEISKTETIAETVTVKKAATLTLGSATASCTALKMKSGSIAPHNTNKGTLTFESCTIVGGSHCEVPNFNSEPLVFPLERSGSLKLNFQPASGSTLAVIVVKNNGGTCSAAGTYTMTSGPTIGMECNYPDVETEKKEHRLVFNSETGSEVFVNHTRAAFEGEFVVTLLSGNNWSAK